MLIAISTHKVGPEEREKLFDAHIKFLDGCYKKGILLASGPQSSKKGGVLVAKTKNEDELQALLQQDPFVINNITEYVIIDFIPTKFDPEFERFIK